MSVLRLPGQQTGLFACEKVPMSKCQLCPGSLGLGASGQDFGSRCSWRSKFSSLRMLGLHDLQLWSVVFEK